MKISINKLADAYVMERWDIWRKMLGVDVRNKEDADKVFNGIKIKLNNIKIEK